MTPWDSWIGRETTARDTLTAGLVARFKAALDTEQSLGIHWCLCVPDTPTAALGADGHPQRGLDLPPIPLARRMWAASDVAFHAPLLPGAAITRRSVITAITAKTGATGPLVFVEIAHETHADGRLAVTECQTLVYRGAAIAAAAAPAAADTARWDWHRDIIPDTALLFRHAALTFNSHRIHYDLSYATAVEGYRGLVVQGPLTASLLLDLAAQGVGADRIAGLKFRGTSPAIAGEPLMLCGRADNDAITLRAGNATGAVMTATATLRLAGTGAAR
ncbi:MAG: MaoC family dehydratase N-terminal domain-containing protein [Sandarakinorhabdus sp.]|nr:MaoC family dehydratase N-terminal domain-containing protein [Sandarakinorhabdus sp.]